MMADHFIDDEPQEFFCKIGIELCVFGELTEPGNLGGLAARIAGGKSCVSFVAPHRLCDLEPFGEHEDQRGVDIVDAVTILVQLRIGHAGLPPLHLP
jgi:hypothetical protein